MDKDKKQQIFIISAIILGIFALNWLSENISSTLFISSLFSFAVLAFALFLVHQKHNRKGFISYVLDVILAIGTILLFCLPALPLAIAFILHYSGVLDGWLSVIIVFSALAITVLLYAFGAVWLDKK